MSATNVSMLRTCCLIMCLVAGSRQLSITEFVVPSAVKVNETAELHCLYDLKPGETVDVVKWWWTPTGNDKKQLYQRINGHAGESTQHDIKTEIRANDTIVLLELQPKASGKYECEVSMIPLSKQSLTNIDEVRKQQELIVYTQGTGPQLNVSEVADGPDADSDDDIRIECQTDGAAPLPDLAVTVNGEDVNITEIVTGPDAEGLYNVFANVTMSKSAVLSSEIQCKLFFTNIVHPEYIVSELYDPLGALTSTEMPEDTTQLDATPDSLENSPDDGSQLRGSWAWLMIVPVLAQQMTLL